MLDEFCSSGGEVGFDQVVVTWPGESNTDEGCIASRARTLPYECSAVHGSE